VNLGYNPEHVAVVHKGWVGVVREGTSARVFAGAAYQSAGKTGTAQAVTIARRVFDHGLLDHYPSEEDMAAAQKGQAQAPIGLPRNKSNIRLN